MTQFEDQKRHVRHVMRLWVIWEAGGVGNLKSGSRQGLSKD